MLYGDRSRIKQITIAKNNSLISDIDVTLFTGPINLPSTNIYPMKFNKNHVHFWTDDWINFETTQHDADLLYGLRHKINSVFIKFLRDPNQWCADDWQTLQVLYRVLSDEEQYML